MTTKPRNLRRIAQTREHPVNLLLSEQNRPLRNELSLIFYCKTADELLISRSKNRGIFFPAFRLHPREMASSSINKAIESVLKHFPDIKAIDYRMIRLAQLPVLNGRDDSITLYSYVVYVESSMKYPTGEAKVLERQYSLTKSPSEVPFECSYQWIARKNLPGLEEKFWGPEVLKQSEIAAEFSDKLDKLKPEVVQVCAEAVEELLTQSEEKPAKSASSFIQHVLGDSSVVNALWNEWVFHTAPSMEMSLYSFIRFLGKLDITATSLKNEPIFHKHCTQLYNAILHVSKLFMEKPKHSAPGPETEVSHLKISHTGNLQFLSFCLGLSLLDGTSPAFQYWDINMSFTFWYFSDNGEKLSFQHFQEMTTDIRLLLPTAFSDDDDKSASDKNKSWIPIFWSKLGPETELSEEFLRLKSFKDFHQNNRKPLFEQIFMILARAAAVKFRPTGSLLSVIQSKFMVQSFRIEDLIDEIIDQGTKKQETQKLVSKAEHYPETEVCSQCRETDYEMRLQRIKIGPECRIEHIKTLGSFESYQPEEGKIGEDLFHLQSALFTSANEPEAFKEIYLKSKSEMVTALEALKVFYENRKSKLFENISGSAVIFPAVNGNLPIVRKIGCSIFPTFPHNVPIGTIVLGNYLGDSGGVETLLSLLLTKLLYPNKVIILRGAKDTASHLEQVSISLKPFLGDETFQLLGEILELLPLAAVVDQKIFVSHSGIPRSIEKRNILEESPEFKICNEILNLQPAFEARRKDEAKSAKDARKKSKKSEKKQEVSLKTGSGGQVSILSIRTVEKSKSRTSARQRSANRSLINSPNKKKSKDKSKSKSSLPVTYTLNEVESFLKNSSLAYFIRSDTTLHTSPFRVDNRMISLKNMPEDKIDKKGDQKTDKKADKSYQCSYVIITKKRIQIVAVGGENGEK